MFRAILVLATTIVLGATLSFAASSPASLAIQATPEPAAPVTITSEVLGRAAPVEVTDPALGLGRVTIMPGAVIPVHHHPGTQIGVVVQGTLTYTVHVGTVEWHRSSEPDAAPDLIGAGETVQVPTGDILVENPGAIHQGGNTGDTPVVIYLSTLFPAGTPDAIIDATPVS